MSPVEYLGGDLGGATVIPYATVADVAQLNTGRLPFTASSRPNDTQVIDWLHLTASEIDAILRGLGYDTPVPTTAVAAHKLMEHGNALGAAALVERSAPTNRGDDSVEAAQEMWEGFKKALHDWELDLASTRSVSPSLRHHSTATAMLTLADRF